ncbi:MAG: hypothetical protein KAU20_03820 [Nanoarchaeota archaeon]|nr:hypothetical protein [Nanoarchaeota archaeon]
MGKLTKSEISEKMKVSAGFVIRVQHDIEYAVGKFGDVVPICGFAKRTAYLSPFHDEKGFLVSVEDQMLSNPFYGGLRSLTGWEKVELYRRLLRK